MRRAALQMLTARSAERSISPIIFTAATICPQVARHRRLQREHVVAALLELARLRVDLVVAVDQVVGALEVAVEQHLGRPGDRLDDASPRAA